MMCIYIAANQRHTKIKCTTKKLGLASSLKTNTLKQSCSYDVICTSLGLNKIKCSTRKNSCKKTKLHTQYSAQEKLRTSNTKTNTKTPKVAHLALRHNIQYRNKTRTLKKLKHLGKHHKNTPSTQWIEHKVHHTLQSCRSLTSHFQGRFVAISCRAGFTGH